MAYEIVRATDGQHIAAVDHTGNQFRFVDLDANQQIALAGLGANAFGVLNNKAKIGVSCTVYLDTSVSKVVAGAAVAVDAQVASDATGRAITAATTHQVLGRALTPAAAAGEIISVYLEKGKLIP